MKNETGQIRPLQVGTTSPQFTQMLSATRRGARLARLLAVEQLSMWGWVRDGERTEVAALVVTELAANAVLHGRLPGRCFRLGLGLEPARLRIEVTDPSGERLPAVREAVAEEVTGEGVGEGGRGLVLVAALAENWGVRPHPPSGKTVWAYVSAPGAGPGGDHSEAVAPEPSMLLPPECPSAPPEPAATLPCPALTLPARALERGPSVIVAVGPRAS
jgi:anti-sigma regulatory factor (Ser/Thr protein kinase)